MIDQVDPLFVEYSNFTVVITVDVQVIFWFDPAIQFSPPFGALSVIVGTAAIVKAALLISFVALFDASLILTRAWTVGVFGTVQVYVPADAAVLAMIVLHEVPLLVEYSIFTLEIVVEVHEMACELPVFQDSPPLGDRTVTDGAGNMVKTALLTSFVAVFEESLTRTNPCVVGVFGTVHA